MLVVHSPPHGHLDGAKSLGSRAILETIIDTNRAARVRINTVYIEGDNPRRSGGVSQNNWQPT